jgi:hypothetical protein
VKPDTSSAGPDHHAPGWTTQALRFGKHARRCAACSTEILDDHQIEGMVGERSAVRQGYDGAPPLSAPDRGSDDNPESGEFVQMRPEAVPSELARGCDGSAWKEDASIRPDVIDRAAGRTTPAHRHLAQLPGCGSGDVEVRRP